MTAVSLFWDTNMAAGRSGRSKANPEIITIIPKIENKFDLNAAEVAKKKYKNVRTAYGRYLKLEKVRYVVVELFLLVDAAKSKDKADNKA